MYSWCWPIPLTKQGCRNAPKQPHKNSGGGHAPAPSPPQNHKRRVVEREPEQPLTVDVEDTKKPADTPSPTEGRVSGSKRKKLKTQPDWPYVQDLSKHSDTQLLEIANSCYQVCPTLVTRQCTLSCGQYCLVVTGLPLWHPVWLHCFVHLTAT